MEDRKNTDNELYKKKFEQDIKSFYNNKLSKERRKREQFKIFLVSIILMLMKVLLGDGEGNNISATGEYKENQKLPSAWSSFLKIQV